jgi:nicotinate phosphoribosyltransferase
MQMPSLPEIQKRSREQLTKLHATVKRLQHPHEYPAGVERTLHERKMEMMRRAKP